MKKNQVVIVPVLSAPIKINLKSKVKTSSDKSSSISRLFRLGNMQDTVEICEESGFELDKVSATQHSVNYISYLLSRSTFGMPRFTSLA